MGQSDTNHKWNLRFLALCNHVAEWSKDPSTKVGAVIVDDKRRIVSLGYNGVPMGVEEAPKGDREAKLLRTIHAEENAIHFANRDLSGCVLYVNAAPCAHCAAIIIQRGIKRVVYGIDLEGQAEYFNRWAHNLTEAGKMFEEADVKTIPIIVGSL